MIARKQIVDVAQRIALLFKPQRVVLFGSYAYGTPKPESDVDLLVDMQSGRSLMDLGGLWSDLNSELGIKVDVVTEKGLKKRIRERVLSEAVPL